MSFSGKTSRMMVLVAAAFLLNPAAHAENTRVTNPNAVTLEIMGRGLFYSIQFDRALNDDLSAGIGFGSPGVKDNAGFDVGRSATMIPTYVNYYFSRDQGSLLLTAGATLVANASQVGDLVTTVGNIRFSSSALMPTFGLGYENRGDNGFIVRINAYGLAAKKIYPWFGFGIGATF